MSDNKINRKHKYVRYLGFLVLIAAYSVALAAGYGTTVLIYRFVGTPPELVTHIFTGLMAIVLLILVQGFLLIVTGHLQKEHNNGIQSQLTDALQQISQGNFDILLDPTERHMNHELAEAINDMAKKLGTLETMRQDFISNVSHEIQSPLTSIGGFAALLKQEDLPVPQRRRYAEIIAAESKRLSRLSDHLLKLSTLDDNSISLDKKAFRLDKQLESVILTLEPQWSVKNIALAADLQKCSIEADEALLSQVWINLLHNAIKFTPENGQIYIVLDTKDGCGEIKLSDTGVGIAPDDQIHIFERFFKADKARDRSLGGNGLGLSIVKRIVELHDGDISVQSEVGKGTTFCITLPIT